MSIFIDKPPDFSAKLIDWYLKNLRDLPWRATKDPYKIWLSEIILQQTRVDQGLNYYYKFIRNYPELKDLALADEEHVLKDWQGLGYYSRARNLHFTAKFIQVELNGEFPTTYEQIKALKGVGEYTAAAIASFAFGLPHAVVDGNVYRVLARIYGIDSPIDSSRGKKLFAQMADNLLDRKNPGLHNQSIMEFGAVHCLPKNPNCGDCIFQAKCVAFQQNKVNALPYKQKKLKQRDRFFHYLIIENADRIIIHKRDKKEIWQNLYDFPLIETSDNILSKKFIKNEKLKAFLKNHKYTISAFSDHRKHTLSHQVIHAKFYHIALEELSSFESDLFKVILKKELKNFPIPKLIENYLREETNLLSLS